MKTRNGRGPRFVRRIATPIITGLAILSHSPKALSQCDEWQPMDHGILSAGWVQEFIEYDGKLIASGNFTNADGSDALRLARWDGEHWLPFAGSVRSDTATWVDEMVIYNGDLVIGGTFAEVEGVPANHIARWDGERWYAFGTGFDERVEALIVYDGDLIAGGVFEVADGRRAWGIARWDGSTWLPMGGGFEEEFDAGSVWGLTEYRGDLIAVGGFDYPANNVARWDGTRWQPLGSGTNGSWLLDACSFGDDLIVAGLLSQAGGKPARGIARWDGSQWYALGDGLDDSAEVLLPIGENLYVGGDFTQSGSKELNHVARWDGSTWYPLGEGTSDGMSAMYLYQKRLIAGGLYRDAGGQRTNSVAAWDGRNWAPMAGGFKRNGDPESLVEYHGELFAAGLFDEVEEGTTGRIAYWDGDAWQGMQPDPPVRFTTPEVLCVYDDELVVAGRIYVDQDPDYRGHLSSWNGSEMKVFENGPTSAPDCGLVVGVDLIVGGSFRYVGDMEVNRIARWDGSSWHAFGAGVDSGSVKALAEYRGEVIAGGSFWREGYVARWDGAQWQPLGGGVENDVWALAVYEGDLIAGGQFEAAGGVDAMYIARWDGNQWHALPGGDLDGRVEALGVYNGDLIVVGTFDYVGSQLVNGTARWDGANWYPIGDGVDTHPKALAVYDDSIVIAGEFAEADHRVVNSVAQWRDCVSNLQLDVNATCPGGGPAVVTWEGATPNGGATLVFARRTGHVVVPYGPCAGITLGLGLNAIQVVWTGRSDADGHGEIHRETPSAACGGYLQLIDLNTCETSNVARIE